LHAIYKAPNGGVILLLFITIPQTRCTVLYRIIILWPQLKIIDVCLINEGNGFKIVVT